MNVCFEEHLNLSTEQASCQISPNLQNEVSDKLLGRYFSWNPDVLKFRQHSGMASDKIMPDSSEKARPKRMASKDGPVFLSFLQTCLWNPILPFANYPSLSKTLYQLLSIKDSPILKTKLDPHATIKEWKEKVFVKTKPKTYRHWIPYWFMRGAIYQNPFKETANKCLKKKGEANNV